MNLEVYQHIEFLFASVGVILGLFFALFLLVNYKAQPKANIFLAIYLLAFSLRIGKALFHNYVEINSALRTLFLSTLLCVGPSLWLYAKNLLKPKDKSIPYLLHYIPFFLLLLTFWMIPNDGPNPTFAIFYNCLTLHMFGYTAWALIWVIRQKTSTPSKEFNEFKRWLLYFLGINVFVIITYFLISEMIIPFYLGFAFLFSLTIVFLAFWALRNPSLIRLHTDKYSNSSIGEKEASTLMKNLKELMHQDKPYLDPDLTLAKLSDSLDVTPKQLSQAINQIENLNYSQFVAIHRIEEAKRLMAEPTHAHFTIAAIAYDSGFNSISSFNSQFKKHTKTTAISYRKSLPTE